ncbi:MAG: DoxX family protein [Verrucomicrobiota bacterium]
MKYLPNIFGGLLGLAFIASAVVYFFKFADMPPPPAGSPAAHFMAAFIPTGYMHFVKVCEVLGGVLVAIPHTRNFGLLILGPIILNIIAFHLFVTAGADLAVPAVFGLIAAYLLWTAREKFAALRN